MFHYVILHTIHTTAFPHCTSRTQSIEPLWDQSSLIAILRMILEIWVLLQPVCFTLTLHKCSRLLRRQGRHHKACLQLLSSCVMQAVQRHRRDLLVQSEYHGGKQGSLLLWKKTRHLRRAGSHLDDSHSSTLTLLLQLLRPTWNLASDVLLCCPAVMEKTITLAKTSVRLLRISIHRWSLWAFQKHRVARIPDVAGLLGAVKCVPRLCLCGSAHTVLRLSEVGPCYLLLKLLLPLASMLTLYDITATGCCCCLYGAGSVECSMYNEILLITWNNITRANILLLYRQ